MHNAVPSSTTLRRIVSKRLNISLIFFHDLIASLFVFSELNGVLKPGEVPFKGADRYKNRDL